MKVTATDIAQLLATAPPRRVSAHVLKAAKDAENSRAIVLFGLIFGAFGTMFLIPFFPWRMMDELGIYLAGIEAPGVVVGTRKTNMSVNDEPVVAYRFAYTPKPGGDKLTAECYTTGPRWEIGHEVTVRYVKFSPGVACIAGARLNEAGLVSVFVVLFPVVGFGLAGLGLTGRRKTARLLCMGKTAEVDVLSVESTNVQVNYHTQYNIQLSAPPGTVGDPVTVKRWAKPEINLLTQHALQKQPIFVLYDPRKPKHLIFPEALIEP